MYTLFISTFSEIITIGLLKDGKEIDRLEQVSNRNHSIYTIPMIEELLDKNEIKTNYLNEIIVVNGPGSFTGVRIGVTIAKTFAYLLNKEVICLSSLKIRAISTNHDYCLSLNKGGFKIIQVNNAILIHNLGESIKKSVLGLKITPTNHSPLRRYYMSRNRRYIWDKYKEDFPEWILIDKRRFLRGDKV